VAIKSILEIEVNSAAFTRFNEQFKQYEAELIASKTKWNEATQEMQNASGEMDTLVALMFTFQTNLISALDAQRANSSQIEKQVSYAERLDKMWKSMSEQTKSFAANIGHATLSLLKWSSITGVISGILGAGGLFGIDRLAISAGNQRRSALGLGVTPGEQQSFEANYGRVVDPGQILGGVNEALHDVSKRFTLYAAGLSERALQGKDTAEVSAELLPALKRLADQTPANLLANVLQARGLNQFITLEDFERLKNTPAGEIRDYGDRYRRSVAPLELPEGVSKAWQDLQVQLGIAGRTLEQTLIVGLTGLAKPIGDLSASFTHLVQDLLGSKTVADLLTKLSGGIKWLDDEISKPDFHDNVEKFLSAIGQMAKALGAFAEWIWSKLPESVTGTPAFGGAPDAEKFRQDYHDYLRQDTDHNAEHYSTWKQALIGNSEGDNRALIHDFFKGHGVDEEHIAGITGALAAESSLIPNNVNPESGASGLAQWLGPRKKAFHDYYGVDPDKADIYKQLDFLWYEMTHGEKGNLKRFNEAKTAPDSGEYFERDFERPGAADMDTQVRRARQGAQFSRYGTTAPDVEVPTITLAQKQLGRRPQMPAQTSPSSRDFNPQIPTLTVQPYAAQFKDRSVQVIVKNQTGGNASVSASTLTPAQ